mmetsp:Transcript_15080/g.33649  ORF Transcript_15080/g.33649 Transcript_15080/m.33649 type:complete len:82 (-) Transcript_15080:73-318(-)
MTDKDPRIRAAPMKYIAVDPEEKTETSEITNAPSEFKLLAFRMEEPEHCLNSVVEFMEVIEDMGLLGGPTLDVPEVTRMFC